jgi:hypothetical protein
LASATHSRRFSRLCARPNGVVYSKRPFGGPAAVLAYLARYTHRVAIANSRLIALRDGAVTFKWKDYRVEGRDRQKTMTLPVAEFIRRFLIHVLPSGFHRIRHYGLLASGARARNIARVRQLLTPAEQSIQTRLPMTSASPIRPTLIHAHAAAAV